MPKMVGINEEDVEAIIEITEVFRYFILLD